MRIFSMVTHGVGGMKRDDAAATYQVWSSDSYLPGNNKREGAIIHGWYIPGQNSDQK